MNVTVIEEKLGKAAKTLQRVFAGSNFRIFLVLLIDRVINVPIFIYRFTCIQVCS